MYPTFGENFAPPVLRPKLYIPECDQLPALLLLWYYYIDDDHYDNQILPLLWSFA